MDTECIVAYHAFSKTGNCTTNLYLDEEKVWGRPGKYVHALRLPADAKVGEEFYFVVHFCQGPLCNKYGYRDETVAEAERAEGEAENKNHPERWVREQFETPVVCCLRLEE